MWRKGWAGRSFLLGWTLVVAVSGGCGGESDNPGSATGMTMAEYCQTTAELACANLAGCCAMSVEDCIGKQRSSCDESGNNATSRGMAFDADAAQHCADTSVGVYANCVVPSVESFEGSVSSCNLVFTATLKPGASCTFDGACAGGGGLAGGGGVAGVCVNGACTQVPELSVGAPCGVTASGVCQPGSYCDGTCRQRKTMGQSCAAPVECATGWCENQTCGPAPIARICAALMDTE